MPKPILDYFRYFTPSIEADVWGLGVTAAGFTTIAPRAIYPPKKHPADHQFDWAHGRVIEAFQVVYIAAGRGLLDVRGGGEFVVEAGMAFVLLPGVWHRYRPDAETGWQESWLEVQGPLVKSLVKKRVFNVKDSVLSGARVTGVDTMLAALHARVQAAGARFDPELSSRAHAVLASLARAEAVEQPRIVQAVAKAELMLMERHTEPVNMAKLARELGVAYSHFRKEFSKHTGFAPWGYVLNVRLNRARRLLAAGDATLEEVAGRIGFSSAFHFSAAFKKAYGVAPDTWRRRLRERPIRERSTFASA